MNKDLSRYVCALWIVAALFSVGRYLCAAIMAQGVDQEIYNIALEHLGPFMPAMSILCLAGGLALLLVDLITTLRKKK